MSHSHRITLHITNKRGLHARASARFVKLAEAYDAQITVERGSEKADGHSILDLMMLAAAKGSEIHITATGSEAEPALKALAMLVAAGFDEED